MKALTIPSIFTAIDKFTAPLDKMSRNVSKFAKEGEAAAARMERRFRKVGDAAESIALKTGVAGAAIVAPLGFAVKTAMDYEAALASLSAITGVTGTQFEKFKTKIEEVSKAAGRGPIEVAKTFELAGSAMPELLKSADALSAVSNASITLSKASGDNLENSIRSLTGAMNQFGLGADQSDRAINALAAGAKVGAATIVQTSDAMVNFGAVAAQANLSLEQATGAIQVMSKFGLFGAEAGTKLRGSILKLQQAGVGYASGQFNINDALAEAKSKMDKLSTAKERDAALSKMFGAENITTGSILLKNIGLFKEYTAGISGTNEAYTQAGIKNDTLAERIKRAQGNIEQFKIAVGDALLPALTDLAIALTPVIKSVADFAKEHPGLIKIVAAFGGLLLAISGISSVVAIASTGIGFIAKLYPLFGAFAGLMTNWIWPILQLIWAVIVTIGQALAAAAGVSFGALVAIFAVIASIAYSIYRNWDMIVSAFKDGGILAGLKAIGVALFDAILWPLQKVLEIAGKIPGKMGAWARAGAASVEGFRGSMGIDIEDGAEVAPAANSKAVQTEVLNSTLEKNTNKNVTVDFKNLPAGAQVTGDGQSNSLMPFFGSTLSFAG